MADAAPEAAPPAKKRGRLIPVIIVGLLLLGTPVGTWFVLDSMQKSAKALEGDKPKREYIELGAPAGLPVPLVRTQVMFVAANPDKGVPPFIVPTNATPAKGVDRLAVQLAGSGAVHYAVTQVYMVGRNTDLLIHRLNSGTNSLELYDKASKLIGAKTLKETQEASFKSLVRGQLLHLCLSVLGTNALQEVVLTEFITQ
jgi:hypothetical protein